MNEKNDVRKVLDELPVIELTDCQKCGAKQGEYTACNADETGTTDCNKCKERLQ